MNVPLMISRRLRLAGDGRGPSRSGVVIAVAGIAIALAVMMMSVAVVVGFKDAISAKVAGFEAPLTIIPVGAEDISPLAVRADDSVVGQRIRDVLRDYGGSIRVARVMDRPGVLKTDEDFLGVVFRAYGPEHEPGFEKDNLVAGVLPSKADEIVVSQSQADMLHLDVGSRVFCHFISEGAVKTRRFDVAGIYNSNFGEYDRTIAYASDKALSRISGVGTDCYEARGLAMSDIDRSAAAVQSMLDRGYASGEIPGRHVVQTVWQRGAMFFNWLGLLDTNVVVILVLMACVSGFTLVSSLIILILERVRLIGILKSIGTTNGQIRAIFLWLGARIVLIGLLIGNFVALGLIAVQRLWRFIPLDPKAYYLDFVPVSITPVQVLVLNGAVLIFAILLMLVPAAIISRISPASVMRYE